MFREMRRNRQQLPREACVELLEKATHGVLALLGDEGYPYAVPISYVYSPEENRLYFHSARSGHKLDAIKRCGKASFCVVDQDQVVPEEYTTYYRSVVAFGRLEVLEGQPARAAMERLAVKYYPEDSRENRDKVLETQGKAMCVLGLTVEHLTGKEAKELTRTRQL